MRTSERRTGSGAGGVMVCVLLFSGLCLCLREYHFVDEPMFWSKAEDYCKGRYTDLATIYNLKDVERLKEAVGGGFQGHVWFGLFDGHNRWKWSLYKPSFYGPGEYDFRRWHEGEPNNTTASGRLCVASRAGTWFDLDCDTEFPFVCWDTNLSNSSFRFILVEQKMSWRKAANYCRTHHSYLVSVRNESENLEVQRLAGDDRFVWIGLFRYPWSLWAGDKSKFNNWLSGHPKEGENGCAASVFDANHAGEWVEMKCRTKLPFFCYQKLKDPPPPEKTKVFHIKITLESTVDLNHPAVTESLLDQIQEKMRETGLSRDLRVSWKKKSNEEIFNKEKKKKKKKKSVIT